MSMAEPFNPKPFRGIEDIHDDQELRLQPGEGPDILPDIPEPEQAAPHLARELPIRKPAIGEQLTEQQLAEELGAD
ncbi:MAG TPA: hypothetical protein VFQ74_02940 [Pseudolysinimonas sp.]|nr:hypothetical protein [Pseudolysinimonas sp.]